MTGETRRAAAEARLQAVEAEYLKTLRAALVRCEGGQWGLFGQNERVAPELKSKDTAALFELAGEIDDARRALGWEAFALHARFVAMRGRGDSNQPGEPKLARALLAEIAAEPEATRGLD